jgi:hypothetical protein
MASNYTAKKREEKVDLQKLTAGFEAKPRKSEDLVSVKHKATGPNALALLVMGKHGIRFHIPAAPARALKDAPAAMRSALEPSGKSGALNLKEKLSSNNTALARGILEWLAAHVTAPAPKAAPTGAVARRAGAKKPLAFRKNAAAKKARAARKTGGAKS